MRRLFWLTMGMTIGGLVVRKASQLAQKLTPRGMASGLSGRLAELAEMVREFGADVRAATAAREAQLRESTGLDGRLGKAPPD